MNSSSYVGRVGGLALALGVGAAVLTNCAIATADTASPDSSSSASAANDTTSTDAAPNLTAAKPARGAAARAARIAAAADPSSAGNETRSPAATRRGKPAGGSVASRLAKAPKSAAALQVSPAPAAAADAVPAASPAADLTSVPASATEAATTAPAESITTATPAAGALSKAVSNLAAAVLPSLPTPAKPSVMVQAPSITPGPAATVNDKLGAVAQLALAVSAAAAATTTPTANSAGQSGPKPTLVLDGYNVVPNSVETVNTFYGRWTTLPGLPNSLQGKQGFDLVDPSTQQKVGSFDALVSQGDPTSLGTKYVSMFVTANDGSNVGTGVGQTPPVGSLISAWTVGPSNFQFGLSYSAMPTESGDKVSFKLQTPFGSFKLPMPFDAIAGVADRSFFNIPTDLTNGYSIVPSDSADVHLTGSAGVLPLFTALQGHRAFDMVDSNGVPVGAFEGDYTTTADILGIHTQAILVTANDGINVGTQPGQIPPVGTVYNVIYLPGSDNFYALYSSSPTGANSSVTATKLVTPSGSVTLPLPTFVDSSKEPVIKLVGVGGKTYVATSEFLPAGINGLPPRDVQYQGYQQFDVKDWTGTVIGSIDADVTTQWEMSGVKSKALLVTNVRSGTVGTGPEDIPPPGTTMTFTYFPGGLGYADAVIPKSGYDINAFTLLTPFGQIPLFPALIPQPDRAEVKYTNPFLI